MIEGKKVIAIIMARMGSTRFPGKALANLHGKPILQHIVERLKKSQFIDNIVIATTKTDSGENLPIIELAEKLNVEYSYEYGSSALDEFMKVIKKQNPQIVVRATGDCPLVSPEALDRMIAHLHKTDADYTHNRHKYGVLFGMHAEVVKKEAMDKVLSLAKEKKHLDHITLFILENPNLFKISNFAEAKELQDPNIILTVDRPEELNTIEKIFNALGDNVNDLKTLTNYIKSNPEFREDEIDYHMDFMNVIHGEL